MADATPGALHRQVARSCRQLQQAHGLPFADCLPAQTIHDALRQLGGFFRERLYTPAVTLWTFLSQLLDADHSCRQAVARLLAWRTAQGLSPCSPDNSAYCKARGRLPEELLARLTRDSGQAVLAEAADGWLWKGRIVKVVDGTCLSMPDSPANQKAYPQHPQQKAGAGFPLLRLVVLFSLAVGTALDAAFGAYRGKGTGELPLFRRLWEQLRPGDVLLGDCHYCTYAEVTAARARGVDMVVRWPARRWPIDFCAGRRLGRGDKLVRWYKPKRPEWMSVADYKELPEAI